MVWEEELANFFLTCQTDIESPMTLMLEEVVGAFGK